MKPNAIKKKVGTLKYYLDQTISSSPTTFTDEQVSEIILKYFTGLESSPNSKGKYIKGARKTVTLTDGKTPTTLSLSTGASFKVSSSGDTTTFTSAVAPAKGDAAGVSSQFVHTITTIDGTTSHSFTQTRMVGDRPISQETFTVELPKGSTFSKDNLPNIYVADSSYSQVDPLAPRIATPVQNKPVVVAPIVPTALVPVDATVLDEEETLTLIPRASVITPIEDTSILNQGDTHMADTPRREDQGLIIARPDARTNGMHFESIDDWVATCREIAQINRQRAAAGQPPLEYPIYETHDEHNNPVVHTYDENIDQAQTGLVPVSGQRRERPQSRGGMILRPTNPVGRREEVLEGEFVDLTDPAVRPRVDDDTIHIVEEDDEEMRLWRERCDAIDAENRIRKAQGKKPKKYPRKPKAQVHKKGKKPVKNPINLKKVKKIIGTVVIIVAIAVVVAVTAIVGTKHYNEFVNEPETVIVETDKTVKEELLPETGEVVTVTPETGELEEFDPELEPEDGEHKDEVVIKPVVPEGESGNPLKNPTGGVDNFGPEDDFDDEYTPDDEVPAKGVTDTSGTQTNFGKNANKGQNQGAPVVDGQELGGQ